jgi:hypothetical protein
VLVGLVAVLHLYFLALEMFLWTKPIGLKTFRNTMKPPDCRPSATPAPATLCGVGRLCDAHDFWRMERVAAAAQAARYRIVEGKPA